MSKRPSTGSASGGTKVAEPSTKIKREDEIAELRASLNDLTKEQLVEKCLSMASDGEKLRDELKRAKRTESLARIRFTIKDKEHRAMAREQCVARWKILGDPSHLLLARRGAVMEGTVMDALTSLRDEAHGARRDLDSAKAELHALRGKAPEEHTKEWERQKAQKAELEKLRVDAKKKAVVDKELAVATKASQIYKQQIKELEKELAQANARIRVLEEEPKEDMGTRSPSPSAEGAAAKEGEPKKDQAPSSATKSTSNGAAAAGDDEEMIELEEEEGKEEEAEDK